MGRIDDHNGQDAVMRRRHIHQMLRHIDDYELVKQKKHPLYKYVYMLFDAKGIQKQNFLKYYRRYIQANRNVSALLPHKSGRKFKKVLEYDQELLAKVKKMRSEGFNRYDIADLLKEKHKITISASATYRLMKKLGINKLNPTIKEEKRRIIKNHIYH